MFILPCFYLNRYCKRNAFDVLATDAHKYTTTRYGSIAHTITTHDNPSTESIFISLVSLLSLTLCLLTSQFCALKPIFGFKPFVSQSFKRIVIISVLISFCLGPFSCFFFACNDDCSHRNSIPYSLPLFH